MCLRLVCPGKYNTIDIKLHSFRTNYHLLRLFIKGVGVGFWLK